MRCDVGFSLVEVLIALLLGSVVIAGVMQLFMANADTRRVLQGQSRMQESARLAQEFLGRNIRQAGYRGCFSTNQSMRVNVDEALMPYEFDLRFSLHGYDAEATGWGHTQTTLPFTNAARFDVNVYKTRLGEGANAGINLDDVTVGTDIITTRNLSSIAPRLTSELTASAQNPVIRVALGWREFKKDHLAMIHDCQKATIFRVTSLSLTAQDLTVGHALEAQEPRNSSLQLAAVGSFSTDAVVSAIETHTFFIAPGLSLNNVGDRPLSLWRKSGLQSPVELVEGVENLQILYGIDSVGDDRIPDQYLTANLVHDWHALITVRITVVANSIDDIGAQTADGLLHRAFTQTIKLRNHG
ncbi:MAG: type IV pilus assembly protein PilW [Crocinitomicaceae bacterium]|jgi:type IV pilus assembly protein PilW